MTSRAERGGAIRQLARLYGIQIAYYDVAHRRREASTEALLLALGAMGAPVKRPEDGPAAIREHRHERWRNPLEPVVVAWEGEAAEIELRLPEKEADGRLACRLSLEAGEVRRWEVEIPRLPTLRREEVEGACYLAKHLVLPTSLPYGYHRLTLENQRGVFETMIVAAPLRTYGAGNRSNGRLWGVFLPLYALHSRESWGAGDFSDLAALMDWSADLGGRVVATLPFLASFLDEPFNPSPYAPVSRLFWNEFYVDVRRVPELNSSPGAQAFLSSNEVQRELGELRSSEMVDYRRQMALKRRVLEEMARSFFNGESDRRATFDCFLEENPAVEDYARFRATCERQRAPWPRWPQPARDGVLKPGDYDEESYRYYLYAQWAAHEQVRRLRERADQNSQQMYLDLPLGVHPHSYDVWRERGLFALDASTGASPDAVFTKGQDWGFPPLHPERLREQRYRYFVAYLRHHLRHARLLRIDHVMGLHRLFWIPKGADASEGVYVRYPAEEFYAMLSLESHRHGSSVVGENLGTVPAYVNQAMSRHGVRGMYVVQYEMSAGQRPLHRISSDSVASLNTHDMPPFAAFWQDMDIGERLDQGLLDKAGAEGERRGRQRLKRGLVSLLQKSGRLKPGCEDTHTVLKGCLALLGGSRARVVLVNLEDLWLETRPQNIPGTSEGRPNWRRKARYGLEKLRRRPEVVGVLREIDHLRKRDGGNDEAEKEGGEGQASPDLQGKGADVAGAL